MIEVLFKGKRTTNGEWVYGYLTHTNKIFSPCIHAGILEVYEVDIDTVCQFTGLLDKNNNRIFEGDKFKFKFTKELHNPIELVGSFDWNYNDLCYEIDIYDHEDYVCLSYVGNGVMYDFELI